MADLKYTSGSLTPAAFFSMSMISSRRPCNVLRWWYFCVVVVEGLVAYGTFMDHNILPHGTSSFVLMPLSLRPVLELCPTSIFTEIPLCPAFPNLMLSKKMTSEFFFVYCLVVASVHCTWVRPWCHGFSTVGVLNVLSKSSCGTCLSLCLATINLASSAAANGPRCG